MATIEFINKRIEGATKNIDKLEKKLARIEKAQATNWEVNPYYYGEDDLRWTKRDLEEARASLTKWQDELKIATQKANSRNVPAILEFLENWKKRVTEFYMNRFEKYPEARAKYYEDMKQFNLGYFQLEKLRKTDTKAYREYTEAKEAVESSFKFNYGFLTPYVDWKWNYDGDEPKKVWTIDSERLAKDLSDEANAKYDFIIERTNAIVETITDASNLSIGESGDLNGYIIGTKATAKVQTIGAGGYNIQCYHFRTLIHKAR